MTENKKSEIEKFIKSLSPQEAEELCGLQHVVHHIESETKYATDELNREKNSLESIKQSIRYTESLLSGYESSLNLLKDEVIKIFENHDPVHGSVFDAIYNFEYDIANARWHK